MSTEVFNAGVEQGIRHAARVAEGTALARRQSHNFEEAATLTEFARILTREIITTETEED